MNRDKLLDSVYKNSKTGLYAIPIMRDINKDKQFHKFLEHQEKQLSIILNTSQKLMKYNTAEEPRSIDKLKKNISIRVGTVFNKSVPNLASMMIINNTESIIDLTKSINHKKRVPKSTRRLAGLLMTVEERNIDILKTYL